MAYRRDCVDRSFRTNVGTEDSEFGAGFRIGDTITPKGYCYTMMIEPNERGLNLVRLPEQLELRLSRLAIVGVLVGMQLQRQLSAELKVNSHINLSTYPLLLLI